VKRTADEVKQRVDDLLSRCRQADMNVTPQRVAVYTALLEADDHPSPEVLFKRVRRKMPSISLATIYKALDALSDLGVVREVPAIADKKRYDANLDKHHHLICSKCRSIKDLYDEELDAVVPPRRLGGFVAHSVSVEVMGLCEKCAAAEKA
jgi:Fur family transcriptional regulator, peroxide stress response regulator